MPIAVFSCLDCYTDVDMHMLLILAVVTYLYCCYGKLNQNRNRSVLLLIDRAIRRNWVILDSLVEKYRMTQ